MFTYKKSVACMVVSGMQDKVLIFLLFSQYSVYLFAFN